MSSRNSNWNAIARDSRLDFILKRSFKEICEGASFPPGMTVMRDISIAKSEFKKGERAITKIQDWSDDPVLFDYCKNPTVSC